MDRRTFLGAGLAAGALSALPSALQAQNAAPASGAKFRMKYAPHFGMFKNHAPGGPLDELKFMADQGFTALEDNGMMGKPAELQEQIRKEMERLGMTMGVFVIDAGDNWKISLTTGKQEFVDRFVKRCQDAVEVAKRVNAKWMTVVPGFYDRNLPIGIQTANVVEAMRRGAAVFEPHGLVMVMEPLSDTPELFLREADQTYEICRAVNSPACKILYDVYHMQRNRGHLIPMMDMTWSEIAYIQIGDNPGRKEPGTGEINYRNIFKRIQEKGFQGILGMEHGNAQPGKEGEIALIKAYRDADSF